MQDQILLARKAVASGDFVKAGDVARYILNTAPSSAEAHHILAKALLAKRDFSEATQSAQAAIAFAPKYAEAHLTLARCYLSLGEVGAAIASARTAVVLVPSFAEAHFTLGSTFNRANDAVSAIQSLRDALAVKPDYVEALNELGVTLRNNGELAEAEALIRKAIDLKPDFAGAHNNLGFVLRQMGRSAEAAASFKIAHDMFEPHLVLRQPDNFVLRAFDNARRYFSVLVDLIYWKTTGHVLGGAWTRYRMLHQASNGVSSDLFSRFMSARQKPKKWRASSVFNWVREADVANIVETLDKQGVYRFQHTISDSLLDQIIPFARTAEATLVPAPALGRARQSYVPKDPRASTYLFDENNMLARPVFQQLMSDPLLLDIAEKYFKAEPIIASISMWWSALFSKIPLSDSAQLFHADLANIKWLKIFLYVTDVTETTGPHSFVPGSHKADKEGAELRRRGLVRFSDEDIQACYGSGRIIDIVGPRGTVFIEDTRGFHKGHVPQEGDRLVFEIYLVNCLYPRLASKKEKLTLLHPELLETIKTNPEAFAGYSLS
jgi:Flp pilus assembly protein TadD